MLAARAIPRVLSIAGSDSGGGAGIQADLKAFAACGVHGMTAITAITAQNTVTVAAVHHVPGEMVLAQIRAVAGDIGVDAVKLGMLGSRATIEAVALALDELAPAVPIVLDPVMISESGSELLEPAARAALVELLLPRASVITPNLPEAYALLAAADPGRERERNDAAADPDRERERNDAAADPGRERERNDAAADPGREREGGDVEALARALHRLGPGAVLVTGGHRNSATDLFFDGTHAVEIGGERHPAGAAHGSGCTHSSVLAARLACGDDPLQAARAAKLATAAAVARGLTEIGAGAGPVDVLGLGGTLVPAGSASRGLLT